MGFDDAAQPVTANFGEYLLPSAPEVPPIIILHHESPTPLNPLGIKGVASAACCPPRRPSSAPSRMRSTPWHVEISQAPIRPHEILALINRSRGGR